MLIKLRKKKKLVHETIDRPFIGKDSLRQQLKKQLSQLTSQFRENASMKVTDQFITNVPIGSVKNISAYSPLECELNINMLIDRLRSHGKTICLPVMKEQDSPMIFRRYNHGDVLCLDRVFRKISEPIASSPEITPEIMIMPLLAFDRRGYRLGYGRGYYDRTLQYLRRLGKKITAVGVGYSCQLFDTIPYDKYDQKLDYAITENEVIRF